MAITTEPTKSVRPQGDSERDLILRASKKPRSERVGNWLTYISLTVLTLVVFVPFFWMISSSLKRNNQVFSIPIKWIPDEFMWSNYVDIWTRIPMAQYLGNTIKLAVIITFLQLLTGSFAAYGFSKN